MLRAVLVGEDIAEVRAVPTLVYGVNFADRVEVARSAEGALVVVGVQPRGLFVTYRVWLGGATRPVGWRAIAERYAELGCLVDVYSEKLVALGCPEERIPVVRPALEADAVSAGFEWEQG